MQVAVWDTYAPSQRGEVLHFDIIVPESVTDPAIVYAFGQQYLELVGEPSASLSAGQCQFCHIETPTEEMVRSISEKGYFILEIPSIPASLPANPTRREMILHLRAHSPQHRFANLRTATDDQLRYWVLTLE